VIRKKAARWPEYLTAEELPSEIEYVEEAARSVMVNAYERNRRAREKCLRQYGRSCAVCGFNFEATYGGSAAGYIQVHHIVPIAKVGKEYRLNPITDLQPVCPNCHAVIHRRELPFSIEEVKQMIQNDGVRGSGAQLGVRAEARRLNRAAPADDGR
jgi:predicted HNH restriction endonuclease